MKEKNRVTYISNAGVMVEIADKKFLIDPFSETRMLLYKNTPKEIKEKMISGVEPFNDVDIIFFTHQHPDHFELQSTVELMKNNLETKVFSNEAVIIMIKEKYPEVSDGRLIISNPNRYEREETICEGMSIKAISMLHSGKKFETIINIAYLIDYKGKKVLHVGDAKALQENFESCDLVSENIDLLLVPFPYISIHAGRYVIKQLIKPKKVGVIHLPHIEHDTEGWVENAKTSFEKIKDDFIDTVFLEKIGDYLNL